MPDPGRLQRLVADLEGAIAAREQGRQVRLPVIPRGDAALLVTAMHAELDDAIGHRDAEVGARLACTKGCNACCKSPVLITEGEAVAIAEYLREHPDARARFEAAYPAWRDSLADLLAAEPSPEQTQAWCQLVLHRQTLCAFNHDGGCTIYPVRPSLCRKAHALDTSEHCGGNAGQVQYYQHRETEAVLDGQRPMKFALHRALRPNARLELVCSAVHRLLGGTTAGRNEPCPCGSGKKYKKCCGT